MAWDDLICDDGSDEFGQRAERFRVEWERAEAAGLVPKAAPVRPTAEDPLVAGWLRREHPDCAIPPERATTR